MTSVSTIVFKISEYMKYNILEELSVSAGVKPGGFPDKIK